MTGKTLRPIIVSLAAIVPDHNYVALESFWQGRLAYLDKTPRERNPYAEDTPDRLAWWIGWDEEEESLQSPPCAQHEFDEHYEAGERCLICRATRKGSK